MPSLFALFGIFAFFTSTFASTVHRRAPRIRNGMPSDRIVMPISESSSHSTATNTSHTVYSTNWAGAVLTAPPKGSTFTSVSAQFIVPSPKSDGAGSAWVGIDGDTYKAAILQTGIDFVVEKGVSSYVAWYEWFPDYALDFADVKISPGDVIGMSVSSSNPSTGMVVIENMTTGQKVYNNLKAPSDKSHLGGQNAEWIVEDYQQDGSLVPFANFGAVSFTNSVATTSANKQMDATGAQILDIKQNNKVVTSSSASGSTISVSHK
ncbi:hypothetical protein K3495_g2131 [Podosphaera aphanis]|nr:hypothetical protein K3495_g2131 [Podosphaera aphanis]